jgi:hypothetical protein
MRDRPRVHYSERDARVSGNLAGRAVLKDLRAVARQMRVSRACRDDSVEDLFLV